MPIDVWEKYGRSKSGSRSDLTYMARGSDDEAAVRAAVAAALPEEHLGAALVDYDLDEIGPELWEAKARYADPNSGGGGGGGGDHPDVGEFRFAFDSTDGTVHITEAIEQTYYNPSGPVAFGNSINVEKGKVKGVDIPVAEFEVEIAFRHPRAAITLAYLQVLKSLRNTTNNAPFYGFAAGELRFKRARGSQSTKADPEWIYGFALEPNLGTFEVGGIEVTAGKKGHEYLWVYYEETDDADAQRLIEKPTAVVVSKIFDEGDFSLLGIGTGS